jgi:uncharacterized protein YegL
MTNQNLCELVCIIDRSGSMDRVKDEAIHGFNHFIEEQAKLEGEVIVSTTLFNTDVDTIYSGQPIKDVKELTPKTYVPLGCTALHDAVCETIDAVGKRIAEANEEDRPCKVIVSILTDGLENSSRRFKKKDVLERIKHQSEKYGWEFIYLAANQDAFAEGESMGICKDNIEYFEDTSVGVMACCNSMNLRVTKAREERKKK